jgi:hypothetical protein
LFCCYEIKLQYNNNNKGKNGEKYRIEKNYFSHTMQLPLQTKGERLIGTVMLPQHISDTLHGRARVLGHSAVHDT